MCLGGLLFLCVFLCFLSYIYRIFFYPFTIITNPSICIIYHNLFSLTPPHPFNSWPLPPNRSITVDEGLKEALSAGREVLFTSNISDKYKFTSADKNLPQLVQNLFQKKVAINKVNTYIYMRVYIYSSMCFYTTHVC
jgi:hypothetical protein